MPTETRKSARRAENVSRNVSSAALSSSFGSVSTERRALVQRSWSVVQAPPEAAGLCISLESAREPGYSSSRLPTMSTLGRTSMTARSTQLSPRRPEAVTRELSREEVMKIREANEAAGFTREEPAVIATDRQQFTAANWNRALALDRLAARRHTPTRRVRPIRQRTSRSRTVARRACSSRARPPGRLASSDDPHPGPPDLTRRQAATA